MKRARICKVNTKRRAKVDLLSVLLSVNQSEGFSEGKTQNDVLSFVGELMESNQRERGD